MDDSEIVGTAISWLLSDVAISHPLYCPQVKSEMDCEELDRSLPLITIWNEDVQRGAFSVSIHRKIVEEALLALLNRGESRFPVLRDRIIEMVQELATATIRACWKDLGDPPSIAFSSKVYLEMVKKHGRSRLAATLPKQERGWLRRLMNERKDP